MLHHLTISHYALIEQLDIDWMPGFSVITGETGAGKSIMLGALNLLLGGRADAKAIQTGEKKCLVEASFDINGLDLEPFFAANDIDFDPKECIVRREVLQSGKSRAFINDTPVAIAKLKEIGTAIIDIHSQHQNLLIRNESFLIETLDVMAGQTEPLAAYKCLYNQCRQAIERLKALQERAAQGRSDEEYLQFQLNQIDEANIQPNEQEELEKEQNLLSHAEDIKQAFYTAQGLIQSDTFSMTHYLRQASDAVRNIVDKHPEAEELAERLRSVRIELEDIEGELEQLAEQTDYDPERLRFIEERLNTLYTLQQKHRVDSVEELLAVGESIRKQLSDIENVDEDIRLQTEEVARLTAMRNTAAARLTEGRRRAAQTTEKELTTALQQMGMPNVKIEISITPRPEPDATGADKVVFLFSANKSIPPQDVSQIASGGEIARLMLSLKALIARRKNLPTIIFDEIDTGVSGTMAERMAQVMRDIASHCQVICITHLPQIAALGTHHFKVYKEDTGDVTRSHIVPLDEKERVEEIAHMLSGAELSQAAIDNAQALLLR
ncbi:DNA repair protein RecN [gut metagenome]|uniref:DNA repair protein RecN n=1 Tax=gut metagenome TaxID=749906 RepID=J9C7S7_9ZZZZ